MNHTIYPCLWFDGKAKEAAELYCSVFPESKITTDTPMVVQFELSGHLFMGLNGGPKYTPNPSISFFVVCETKEETRKAWEALSEGGQILMPLDKYDWSELYGWVQDRYGVSWQLAFGNLEDTGQKISPCLMFTQHLAGKAEEAVQHYTTIFDNSSVAGILHYSATDPDTEGTVKHAQFTLNGQVFMAMDSSLDHAFTFDEGISLVVECDTQDEIDFFWTRLTEGGAESMCGWLEDKYGVSWQIIPSVLGVLMSDPEKSGNVMKALLKMKKLEIQPLRDAYDEKPEG